MSAAVHTGNVLDVLPTLPDNSVHAIVTDPPYGLDIGRLTGQSWDRADTVAFDPSTWREALRVLRPGGLILAFGASRTFHRLASAIEDAGADIEDSIFAWTRADKKLVDHNPAKEYLRRGDAAAAAEVSELHAMFKPAVEPITVARKPIEPGLTRVENLERWGTGYLNFADAYTPTDEDLSRTPGKPSKDGAMYFVRGGDAKSVPHAGGRYPMHQVFVHSPECSAEGECVPQCPAALYDLAHGGKARFFRSFYHSGRTPQAERTPVNGRPHLTVKPVALMEWLVGIASLPGQTVLDPFAGTGSTGVACEALGRHSVLIELDPAFAEVARKRAS